MEPVTASLKVAAEVGKAIVKISKEVVQETTKASNKMQMEKLKEKIVKEAENQALDAINNNADGDDGVSYVTNATRGAIEKQRMPGVADVKVGMLENDIPLETKVKGPDPTSVITPSDVSDTKIISEMPTTPSDFAKIIRPPAIDRPGIPDLDFPIPVLVMGLTPRNDGMTTHPVTDVPYVREEFPDPDTGEIKEGSFPEFDSVFETNLPEGLYEASDSAQFAECNKQLQEWVNQNPDQAAKIFTPEQLEVIKNNPVLIQGANGKTIIVWKNPPGLTWHHNQKPGLMQLVDSKTHAATGHTGGQAIWGNSSKKNVNKEQ